MLNRIPSKKSFLQFFREHGSNIKSIIDVGVQYETRELKEVYLDKFHILIEPVAQFHEHIEAHYKNVRHTLLKQAVGAHSGTGQLVEYNVGDATGKTTHSKLTNDENGCEIEVINLDDIISRNDFAPPCLLKLDTDGNELEILRACSKIFEYCDIVVVESWVDRVGNFCDILGSNGYRLYDIVDLCYLRGVLSQVDLVFIKHSLYENVEDYSELNPVKYYDKKLNSNIWDEPKNYYPCISDD